LELFGYAAQRRKNAKRMGVDSVYLGMFGQAIGAVLLALCYGDDHSPLNFVAAVVFTLATGVLVGGCSLYARHRGLSPIWGLLGFFNAPGFLAIYCACAIGDGTPRGKGFAVIQAAPYRRDVWRMDIRVVVDPELQIGVTEPIMLQVARGASVALAIKTLAGALPRLDEDPISLRCAINGVPADRRDELCEGDELRISGGRRGAEVLERGR
jgi:hypothetical protein